MFYIFSLAQEKWYYFQRQGGSSSCAEKHRRAKSQRSYSSDHRVREGDKSTEDLDGSHLHFDACKKDCLTMCRPFRNILKLKRREKYQKAKSKWCKFVREGIFLNFFFWESLKRAEDFSIIIHVQQFYKIFYLLNWFFFLKNLEFLNLCIYHFFFWW